MLYSFASKERIIMAVDSAETREHSSGQKEYHICLKSKTFPNIGCISTWGARDHNKIFEYLESKKINDIDDLACVVDDYLRNHYKPHELNLDDVGYHVAGFNSKNECRLYHIVYGFDRPRLPNQKERKYGKYDHSPSEGKVCFLYNGRNELAQSVIQHFLEEIKKEQSSRLDIKNPTDLVKLADLITRFSAEITKEISPPFHIYLISSDKSIKKITNNNICPLTEEKIAELFN